MFDCEFCKKSYLTISRLKYHQKNTKKCLQLQEKIKKIIDYNTKFKIEFDKLPKFTEENVKKSLLNYININSFIEGDERYEDDFVKGIKNFIIITDQEKGKVVVKDENGNACRITIKEIVILCLMIIKDEQNILLDEVLTYLEKN
jgi:hypothetical protein